MQEAQYYELGSPEHLNGPSKHFRANPIDKNGKPRILSMPFEITQFQNGLEICDILLTDPQKLIPLDEWLEQSITKFPITVTVVDLIRTVADRGGGAHVHPTIDGFLNQLRTSAPLKAGYDALFTIAIGRFAQQIGYMVFQFYEKLGTKGKIDDLMKIFDQNHPNIKNSAKIPAKLLTQRQSKLSLQTFINAKQVWIDK